MSIFEQFADKPWMRPTMYTSEADPSHGVSNKGIARTSELVNGQVVQTGGREHYQPTEFGDGRPTMPTDNSPMVYRGPNPGAVLDIDDKDELDTAPPEYVPAPRVQPQPPPMTVEQFANLPYRHPGPAPTIQAVQAPAPVERRVNLDPPKTQSIDGFDAKLMGIRPRQGAEAIVTFTIGGRGFSVTVSDLRMAAASFAAWADAASLVQL